MISQWAPGRLRNFQHFNKQMEATLGGSKEKINNFLPPCDVVENDEEFLIIVDLPGLNLEDLEVHYSLGELVLEGMRRPDPDLFDFHYCRCERDFGYFERTFILNKQIDEHLIECHYMQGILTVVAPKLSVASLGLGTPNPQNEPPSRSRTLPWRARARKHVWLH